MWSTAPSLGGLSYVCDGHATLHLIPFGLEIYGQKGGGSKREVKKEEANSIKVEESIQFTDKFVCRLVFPNKLCYGFFVCLQI